MHSKWSMKQMELCKTAHGEPMEIAVPMMQRKLSGEHVRYERICLV